MKAIRKWHQFFRLTFCPVSPPSPSPGCRRRPATLRHNGALQAPPPPEQQRHGSGHLAPPISTASRRQLTDFGEQSSRLVFLTSLVESFIGISICPSPAQPLPSSPSPSPCPKPRIGSGKLSHSPPRRKPAPSWPNLARTRRHTRATSRRQRDKSGWSIAEANSIRSGYSAFKRFPGQIESGRATGTPGRMRLSEDSVLLLPGKEMLRALRLPQRRIRGGVGDHGGQDPYPVFIGRFLHTEPALSVLGYI